MTTKPRALARAAARIAPALALAALALTVAGPPASASTYTAISGSGSSWASVAIDQWAQDLHPNGLVANYNPIGSAAGRTGWINNQYDFVGSDPPFRNGQDELGGTGYENPKYSFSYVPDTAGGTAFMYHITVNGHLITNLRLSPQVLVDIFTGAITNWDDSRITKIYGAQLPNLPITPVVRSDGSGASYFLTRWMAHVNPGQWNAFCQKVHPGIKLPCPQTEFYPTSGWGNGNVKAENGSNLVAAYITSNYGDGAIGYDEYAYALNAHYPVVKVLNPANYFVSPSASNVAVALTKAVINEDPHSTNFLQQDLDHVYTFTDPRSYPLSSYSYLIVPRNGTPPPFFASPAGKGNTLSTFISFMLCAGQRQMAQLGYSPLPLNLVQGGLLQADQIPGHGPVPNTHTLAGCNNPTFTNGVLTLLKKAPYPSPCDRFGAPLNNCVVRGGKAVSAGGGGSGGGGGSSSHSGKSNGTGAGSTTGTTGTNTGTGGTTATGSVTGQVVNLASDQASQTALGVLTALAIIAAVVLPPVLGVWLRRRRQAHG